MEQDPNINILADIEQDIATEPASVGERFLNFLIDVFVFYAVMMVVGMAFGLIFASTGEDIDNSFLIRDDGGSLALQYLFYYGIFLGVYTLLEGAAKGKTLGKLITGTRAIRVDGNDLTWKDAFLRSLCRIVPFEAFSAFGGNPWHDRWTNTQVIKERK